MDTIIKSNIENDKMVDDFSCELLDGKIRLASVRGYISKPKHLQEDAVGSAVKDDRCFLNIVADGLGGYSKSDVASRIFVKEMLNWFADMDMDIIDDTDLIMKKITKKIRKINRKIKFRYRGKAQTTFALSLTNKYNTIILNLGDSTIYTYENDELKLLTYIKFYLTNKSYEQIRRHIFNFSVGSCIGEYPLFKIHKRLIENEGQKLILSSDGVTDLISEERFTNYFINDTDAKTIVNDALTSPDVVRKSEDNISAIVVSLPKSSAKEKMLKR
ncbi:MAG: protein phosphatase 2C domain-containing protein [Bacilli bacterium]|nr:protein phosphatase 2C domain-containing protein [Bacilli bacterium]